MLVLVFCESRLSVGSAEGGEALDAGAFIPVVFNSGICPAAPLDGIAVPAMDPW